MFTDANQPGKTIAASFPRVDFYHWVLVDIPAGTTKLGAGEDSNGVTPNGKQPGPVKYGVRGVNSYSRDRTVVTTGRVLLGTTCGYIIITSPFTPWT